MGISIEELVQAHWSFTSARENNNSLHTSHYMEEITAFIGFLKQIFKQIGKPLINALLKAYMYIQMHKNKLTTYSSLFKQYFYTKVIVTQIVHIYSSNYGNGTMISTWE